MNRMLGTVKFFNEIKGFGFIAPDDGTRDVFVHADALKKSGIIPPALDRDARVEFELEPVVGKGPKAISVKVI